MEAPYTHNETTNDTQDHIHENKMETVDSSSEDLKQFKPQQHQFEPVKEEYLLFALKSCNCRKNNSRKSIVQPKLIIGAPNDRYEQEADRMADLVVRQISTGKIQPQKKKKETPLIQRKCQGCQPASYTSNDIAQKLRQKKGQGSSLPSKIQVQMEQGFGADFSKVRVHTDSDAVRMNKQLRARAFTYGSDVYFNRGEFQPGSRDGKRLLAHELTHVVQQGINNKTILQRNKNSQDSKVRKLTFKEEYHIKAAIMKTFSQYSQLAITLPDNQGVAKLRAAYWIGTRISSLPEHKRLVNSLKNEIETDIQNSSPNKLPDTEIKNQGLNLRIEMNAGKVSPKKLEQFIQIAVNEAYKSSPKNRRKKRLPKLGNDPTKWKLIIQKWINEYQIGIDCSGFVFEALRKVHKDIGGSDAEERYIDQFGKTTKGKINKPMSTQQVDNTRATKVKKPANLRSGDLMQYYKHTKGKVTRHIRIIVSAVKEPQTKGKIPIKFDIAESKGSGPKQGPTIQSFRFPDQTEFKNIEKLVNGKWVRDKKQDKYNYFHPKFEF